MAVDLREAIVQQRDGIVPHVDRIQHDGHELDAVVLCAGNEAAPCGLGIACLDAIAATIEPEHLVLVAQAVRIVLHPRERDLLRAHDLLEARQRVPVGRDERHVVRRRVVRVIRQAVRVDEMRIRRAELLRLFRHEPRERVHGPRDVLRHRDGRIVTRVEHHAVEELAQRDLVSGLQPDRRALRPRGVSTHGHDIVEVPALEREDQRHDLRRARGKAAIVHVPLIEDAPRARLHDDGTARRHARQRVVRREHEPRDLWRLLWRLADDIIREGRLRLAEQENPHKKTADGRHQQPRATLQTIRPSSGSHTPL